MVQKNYFQYLAKFLINKIVYKSFRYLQVYLAN